MKADLAQAHWIDHTENPLIEPPRPDWLIADPAVLSPAQTPDGKWHMYANSVGFIHHFDSDDGVHWCKIGGRYFRGMRPYLYVEDNVYYLLYELHKPLWHSGIVVRCSSDLEHWDEPVMLLRAGEASDGRFPSFLGNPCLLKTDGEYRLYFSCGWIWLWDCLFFEPKYVGVALADSPMGEYRRKKDLIIEPDPNHPYLNFGAGSVKVISDGEAGWWMFNNGIYKDEKKRSRSAIMLRHSADGFDFRQVLDEPILRPEPAGWKRALVYAFDPVVYQDEVRLYYNARDGWLRGSERIGLATAKWDD